MKKIASILTLAVMLFAWAGNAQAQCGDNADCYIVVNSEDLNGSAWDYGGASISISQGGTSLGYITMEYGEYERTDTIRVCSLAGPVRFDFYCYDYEYYTDNALFEIVDSIGTELVSKTSFTGYTNTTLYITPCPACKGIKSLTASGVVSDEATLSWTETGEATSWQYTYGTSPVCDSNWQYTSTPSITLNELQAHTQYYFFVRSDCGYDGYSDVKSISFRTICGDVTVLPFVENFEDGDIDISCWSIRESSGGYPYLDPYGIYGYDDEGNYIYVYPNGNYGLNMMSRYGANSIVSPKVDCSTPVDLVFMSSGIGDLEVGYYTDLSDTTTYTAVKTLSVEFTSTLKKYTVHLPSLSGTYYISLRLLQSINTTGCVIDDLTVKMQSACPEPYDFVQVIDGVTAGQVDLAWNDSVGTTWQIAYGEQGFDPTAECRKAIATSTNASIMGLAVDTVYDFYIRSVCGSDYGEWLEDKVTSHPGAYLMNKSSDTIITCGAVIYDEGGYTGNYGYGYGSEGTRMLTIMPETDAEAIRITGSYDLYAYPYNSSYSNAYLAIFEGTDTTGRKLAHIYSFTDNFGTINVVSESGPVTIYFRMPEYSGYDGAGYTLTATCFDKPDCLSPYGLAMTGSDGENARFSWNISATPDAYTLVIYDMEENPVLSKTIDGTALADTITSGLEERTQYVAVLSSICGSSEGVNAARLEFETPCVVGGDVFVGDANSTNTDNTIFPGNGYQGYGVGQFMVPAEAMNEIEKIEALEFNVATLSGSGSYTFDFDVYLSFTEDSELSGLYEPDSTSDLYFSGTYTFSKGKNVIALDSAVTVQPGKSLVITSYNHTGMEVGNVFLQSFYQYSPYLSFYSTDYSSPSSVTPWTPGSSTWSYYYIPNVRLISPCGDKSCAPVKNLACVPGAGSLTLTWERGGTEEAWRVEYMHPDSTSYTVGVANCAVQTATLTGLEQGTLYTVRVVSLCDGEKTVARTGQFRTECDAVALPLVVDIENFILPSTPGSEIEPCWIRVEDVNNSWSAYPYMDYYSNSLYFSHDLYYGESGFGTLVTPSLQADLSETGVVWTCYSSEGDYYADVDVELGVCTDPADLSTYEVVTVVPLVQHSDSRFYAGSLEGYTGTGKHIFFRPVVSKENTKGDYFYLNIDSLAFVDLPDCPWLVGLSSITGATDNSITLAIGDQSGHPGYNVYYNTTNNFATATKVSFSTSTPTVTGLNEATEYYLWVEGTCGSETSNVVYVGSTITRCKTIAVTRENPYFTDLETETDVYCFSNTHLAGNSPWIYTATQMYPSSSMLPYSGVGALYFETGYSFDQQTMLELPSFDFTGLDTIGEVSFWRFQYDDGWASNSGYNHVHLQVMYRTSATGEWIPITYVDSSEGEYTQHYVKLPGSQGAPFYQVALVADNIGGYVNGVCVDDITVGAATRCVPPTVTLSDITERSVKVQWSESNYDDVRVQYRVVGDWAWSSRNGEGSEGSGNIVIAPLNMLTTYEVRVQSVCAPGEYSISSTPIQFTTHICDSSYKAYNYGSTDADTTISDGLFSANYSGSGNYSYSEVIIPASKMDAAMSQIDMLSFVADAASMGGALADGVHVYMAHTTASELTTFLYNESTFTEVFSGSAAFNAAGEVQVRFDTPFEWDGTSNIVVGFYFNGINYTSVPGMQFSFGAHKTAANTFYYGASITSFTPAEASMLPASKKKASNVVPDIKLASCVALCHEPIVKSTSTTATSAMVQWYQEKDLIVEVSIRPEGASAWDSPTTVSGDSKFTFTGLMPMTRYELRLRRDCAYSGTGYSDEVVTTVLTDTACSLPENVKALSVDAHSITLGWSNTTVANKWQVHVWNDGFNKRYTTTTNPYTVEGLTPGNSYKVRVRAYCGKDDHVVGDWSETVTVQNICQPVAGLNASVQGTNVRLTWNAVAGADSYLVAWGDAGFNPNEQAGWAQVNGTEYIVSGLKGKTYTFRVGTICSEGWNSVWASTNATVVGIDELEGEDIRFSLMPNPATDRVTLGLGAYEGLAQVTILSMDGRQMASFTTTGEQCNVDLSDYAAGTYFVRVQTDEWTSVRKLVVK